MAKKKKEVLVSSDKENILLDKKLATKETKEDITKYIDDRINKVFISELDKANRKLLREKNKKIIIKNVVILILLAIIGFLVYLLYSNHYFDRFFNADIKQIEEKEEVKKNDLEKEKEEVVSKPSLDELKKEYASLLDNYIISDQSIYLSDFYSGNLSSELRNYLVLNSLNFDSLKKNEDYEIISNDVFKSSHERMFSSTYEAKSFDFNGNKIRYLEMMESYITTNLLNKENTLIVREIKDIEKDNETVTITTIEGIIKDSKLYNILDNNLINEYQNDSLLKYESVLNKVIYTFKDNKLVSLSK